MNLQCLKSPPFSNARKFAKVGGENTIGCNGWCILFAALILLTCLIAPSQAVADPQLAPDPNPVGTTINVTVDTVNNNNPYTNYGTINKTNLSTLNNNGSFNNESTGTLTIDGVGSVFTNNSGTLTNRGNIEVKNGSNFDNTGNGKIYNYNIFYNNAGNLTNNSGAIFYNGTLSDHGTAALTNTFNVTNNGTLYNYGTINNNAPGNSITNSGTLYNYGTVTNTAGTLYNGTAGAVVATLNNYGTLTNKVGATLQTYNNTTLNNQAGATLDNYGTLNNGDNTRHSAIINIYGILNNYSTLNNKATLNLASGSSYNFTGGTLNNSNTGTLNLYRDFTFGSAAAGTVNLNAGGTLNNYATLTNNLATQVNAGTFNNNSGATFVVASNFTNTGTFNNNAGAILDINAIFTTNAGGAVFNNSGTLKGTGEIIGNVTNNGTIAPGNSIGTLNITGNYTQSADATYQVEVTSTAGNSDKIAVTGTASLNGKVAVQAPHGNYATSTTYTILTSAGLGGTTYSSVTSNLSFLNPTLTYSATDVTLTLTRIVNYYRNLALTPVQNAVAGSLDTITAIYSGDMVNVFTALSTLSDTNTRLAYEQMSGIVHTSVPAVTFSFLDRQLGMLSSRMESVWTGGRSTGTTDAGLVMMADGNNAASDAANALAALGNVMINKERQNGFWAQGYGSWATGREYEIFSNYNYNTGGAVLGYDNNISPRFLLGVSAGYSQARTTMNDHVSDSINASGFQGSVYGVWTPDPWYVNCILSYAYNSYSTRRNMNFGGLVRTATADYAGNAISARGEAGYRARLSDLANLELIPVAGFRASYLKRNGFTESGADALNLDVNGDAYSSLQSSLGMRMKKGLAVGSSSILTMEASARWLHEYADAAYVLNASFVDYSASTFSFEGSSHVRNSALMALGLTLIRADNLQFFVSYNLNISVDRNEHGMYLGLKYSW